MRAKIKNNTDIYSKTCLKRPLSNRTKMVFKTNYRLMQVKSIAEEHSAILLTFIKQPFLIKIVVLSIFSWPLRINLRENKLTISVDHN